MSSDYRVLVDSDFWCGLFLPDDPHYEVSYSLFQRLLEERTGFVTTTAVVGETATVISHKVGQKATRAFLQKINALKIPTIHLSETLHHQAISLFISQTKRGTSYVDCANVIVMRHFSIPQILSFDKAYFKDHGIKRAI